MRSAMPARRRSILQLPTPQPFASLEYPTRRGFGPVCTQISSESTHRTQAAWLDPRNWSEQLVQFDIGLAAPRYVDKFRYRLGVRVSIAPAGARAVKPYGQRRQNLVPMVTKPSSSDAVRSLNPVETNLSPFPKPTDHLYCRTEPSIKGSQRLYEPDIEVAPKPLRPMTSVVPENREHTSKLSDIVNQVSTTFPSLRLSQIKPMRIEQRSILNVHGELEEGLRAHRAKRLGCSAAVPDGLVVPHAGIISVTCFIQDTKCVLVAQQPMHPDTDS